MYALNDQLKTLRLSHAAKALEQQQEQLTTYAELNFEERLSLLLESEILNRNQTKIERLKRQAKLRVDAQPSQLVYKEGRNLNRRQMSELLTGSYLHKHQNILITGPTGAGKTYLGCALATSACNQQHAVRYYRLTRLLDELTAGRLDGSYQKQLLSLSRKSLLILDDWGMETLTPEHASHLLELLEDRYQNSSTIVISQLPVKEWYNMIGNATVADALLDRLVHNSHRIELGGESMRKLALSDHLE
ncbi:transposase [Maribrevibacterium harenarium]|uniref:Transposase n=1 Tax=Maribrevibacterium harenarium TaxID=2589817 RepID=A0A501W3R7_9GAMM|nr:IS21-like element helper ATPase IstB [Maribrevibacterium harenarium]TPE42940.1 transposase [Maribrevibacterium harenarium]